MQLFDSHCHLQMAQFGADRDEVLARMRARSMGAVVIGIDLALSTSALALAQQHDFLFAAVGLHPNDNPEEVFDVDAFRALAEHDKVVAIGECGLDYYRSGGSDEERAAQKERFKQHVALALSVGKPLIIHCRNAHDDMLEMLAHYKRAHGDALNVVIHFFTGTGELAKKYLDLGCYLSFPGPVTYTDMYDDSIRVAPLDKILIETDSPFAAPVPHRGTRNEPLYVEEVAKKIALMQGVSVEEVTRASVENAARVFSFTV